MIVTRVDRGPEARQVRGLGRVGVIHAAQHFMPIIRPSYGPLRPSLYGLIRGGNRPVNRTVKLSLQGQTVR